MYTEHDINRLAYNEEQALRRCGISDEDVVLITCTIDRCFIAGLAYLSGVRELGASAIRNGLSSLESHRELIKDLCPTVIIGVPSFLKKLGLHLMENNMDPKKTSVSKLVCIGEPLRDNMLKSLGIDDDLKKIWQARTYSTYASSEIVTTFCECAVQKGGHITSDLGIVEIVNDEGEVLPAGSVGEVVVTPLAVEGMPLLRYKTGDVSFLNNEPCECGSFSPRLGPILGRKKQMMKVAGTTIYPQAIYSVLEEIDGVKGYYITASSKNELSDAVEVYLAAEGSGCTVETIQNKLQARIRFKPRVFIRDEEFIKGQVYSQKSRKPTRFIDKRIK